MDAWMAGIVLSIGIWSLERWYSIALHCTALYLDVDPRK
jgi:hypothetical protein